jgi:TatD DNase family protein
MDFKYIDIHSHLNISPLTSDIEGVVSLMREKGVGTITVGTDFETSKMAIEIAEKYPDTVLGATIGLHPNDNEEEIFNIEMYRELVKHPKVVAVGECGLDYFRLPLSNDEFLISKIKEKQKDLFKQHIELALESQKPLMIHARPSKGSMDAYNDVIDILESYPNIRVNFHFFVGDISVAEKIIKNGWTVSFDGPITFARDYDEVIKFLPLESIMPETDAPFAAPVPYRGRTCEPWMVEEVVKKIAEIKEMETEAVKRQMVQNAERVFFHG